MVSSTTIDFIAAMVNGLLPFERRLQELDSLLLVGCTLRQLLFGYGSLDVRNAFEVPRLALMHFEARVYSYPIESGFETA